MYTMKHRCLFNHELLIIGTSQTPFQSYEEDITDDQVRGLILELKDTAVDTIMCCPTAWRRNLWFSDVDRHWQEEAPAMKEPHFEHDFKYYEKAYYRLRRYMLKGKDPVALSLEAAHETGKSFFISYRMNDHHYLDSPQNPCHNTFWREHPEYQFMPEGAVTTQSHGYFNYLFDPVRRYYFQILHELVSRYDIDGLELDFMRSPFFFPDPNTGRPVMTGFVRSVRQMLDRYAAERKRPLPLCIRVPHEYHRCEQAGLDVSAWAKEQLVDMVNISSYYINDPDLDFAAYRKHMPQALLFGEMHFIVDHGEMPGPYTNNVTRKTSREMYYAMAERYWADGADGLSFFNFDYVRHHHFNEPRRKWIRDSEPPFDVPGAVMDRERLAGLPKHYYWRANKLRQNPNGMLTLNFSLPANLQVYPSAILRIVTEDPYVAQQVDVQLNQHRPTETDGCGELFAPPSHEALYPIQHMRFFRIDPLWLEYENSLVLQTAGGKIPRIKCVDLALYPGHAKQDQ